MVVSYLRFLSFESKTLLGAGGILALFSLVSRILGLYRDRVLASNFGASDILDVYYVSFGFPDLIFNILVAGAVSSAFIPLFIEFRSQDPKKAWELTNHFLNSLVVLIAVAVTLGFIFMSQVVSWVAPGFSDVQKEMAVLFGRVMIFSPLIFGVSIVMGSLLQAYKRFLAFSIAPIFYNIGIIIGAVWFVPLFGPLGLAEGVVLGAFLHLMVQLIETKRLGFEWKPVLNFHAPGLGRIFRMMLPRSASLASVQFNWIVINALATTAFSGGAAIINFAYNLQYLPIALVGISLGIASFPDLSEKALDSDKHAFSQNVSRILRLCLFLSVPLSALMFIFSDGMVRILLGAGLFGADDVAEVSRALKFFAFGISAASALPILNRAFYAIQNTKIPFAGSILGVAVNVLLAWYLFNEYGLAGLPISFSAAVIANGLFLVIAMSYKIKSFSLPAEIFHTKQIIALTILSVAPVYLISDRISFAGGLMGDILRIVLGSLLAVVIFVILCVVFRIKEVNLFRQWVKSKN